MTHRRTHRLRRAVLLVFGVLVSLLAIIMATGAAGFVITNGVSMNPVYFEGDLVVVARSDSYEIGDIAAYRMPDRGVVVLHRITARDVGGFTFKGDNNQSIDSAHPSFDDLVGHAVLHIPQLGHWVRIFTNPVALVVLAFALTGGTAANTRRRRKRKLMADNAITPTPLRRVVATMPHQLQIAVAVIGLIGVLGVLLGAVSWAASPEHEVTAAASSSQEMTYSYSTQVPLSPAYDGTTVHSPDPIFRKLTDTVDIRLAYKGSPGNISVAAELSNQSGWHSRVPLAAPVDFAGDHYDATVTLDLGALDALAQSAATVTGLPAAPLTVAVAATIRTADGGEFITALKMSLEPLKLSLAGDSTMAGSTTVAETTMVPNTLGLGPLQSSVVQARVLSVVLILATWIASVILLLIGRRRPPVSESARIHHRYKASLAAVDPMPFRPNVPIIEVNHFATLAKLSGRCGQLVLYWARSGIETFVVLDEGTTYRYRVGASAVSTSANGPAEHIDECVASSRTS